MSWTVDDRSPVGTRRERLLADLRVSLAEQPPRIPPKWFYDEKGSLLFEQITELEEYYPTRTEEAILRAHAAEVPRVRTVVELGSGTSRKTRLLLDSVRPELFVPVDVSREVLISAAQDLARDYPAMDVHAVVADFDDDLAPLPGEDRLVVFLGGTIGNYPRKPRADFLRRLAGACAPGDRLLLGADLVKDAGRLERAYDDAAGTTAEFNRNVLRVLAAEAGAEVDVDAFEHRAVWDPVAEHVEMRLVARTPTDLVVPDAGVALSLAPGDHLHTETSAKFRLAGLEAELAAAGFAVEQQWTDDAADFSLTLAVLPGA